jgi:hypothetical protein
MGERETVYEFIVPEWAMVGCLMPNGKVRLIASRELDEAELQAVLRSMYFKPKWTLQMVMVDYIVIEANDYPSAFQHLFETWTPGKRQPQSIEATRAIARRSTR